MALTDALREITPANGYQHDVSHAVFRGMAVLPSRVNPPILSLIEPPVEPEGPRRPETTTEDHSTFPLILQGIVKDGHEHPTDPAYRLLADAHLRLARVRRDALRRSDGSFLGLARVTGLDVGRGVVSPPDTGPNPQVSGAAYFWLPLGLTIAEDHLDPFA